MAARRDPTETTMLQRAFARAMRARFTSVALDVWKEIAETDALGLLPTHLAANADFRFRTNDQKVTAFRKWITELANKKILSTDATGKPWTGKFVESAYKKGVIRAFIDTRGKALKKGSEFFAGTKEQFLRVAFNQPEKLSKVQLLATRAFEELRGVSNEMATKLNRILANGLLQGKSPREIARTMVKEIKGLSKARAERIARTEIVHAHAEGQLDSFEEQGVEEVGVLAEWSTAGDDKVCPECSAMEGTTIPIKDARGLIPRHPNCRCAWIPSTEVTSRARIKAAIEKSLLAEKKPKKVKGKKESKAERLKRVRRGSTWAGKKKA